MGAGKEDLKGMTFRGNYQNEGTGGKREDMFKFVDTVLTKKQNK